MEDNGDTKLFKWIIVFVVAICLLTQGWVWKYIFLTLGFIVFVSVVFLLIKSIDKISSR